MGICGKEVIETTYMAEGLLQEWPLFASRMSKSGVVLLMVKQKLFLISLLAFLCTCSHAQLLYRGLSKDSVLKILAHTEIDSHLYNLSPETQSMVFKGATIAGHTGTYSVEFGGTDSIILFRWEQRIIIGGDVQLISPKVGFDVYCYLKNVFGEPQAILMSSPNDYAKCFRWQVEPTDPPRFYQLSISNYYVRFTYYMYEPNCPEN
jgi:hypothetical protein